MSTKATYKCDAAESLFYLESLNFPKTFDLDCKKNIIFGKTFPYWEIPETNYPEKNEIFCAFQDKCYNFPELNPIMAAYNLSDTFDEVNIYRVIIKEGHK